MPIPTRLAEVGFGEGSTANYNGAGRSYLVRVLNGNLYLVFIDAFSDVVFTKSTNNGLTWSNVTVISVGSTNALAVWYDRWSGIAGGLIHCAYTDNGVDDILYRSINTESSDALGSQTTVFAGSTAVAGGALSITRGRNGDLRVAGSIDAGTEDGAWSSTDAGATWADTIADPSEAATEDQYLLLPGWNADTADIMLIFWDASVDELSVKRYDDSGNTWAETSIATGMVNLIASLAFPNVAAAVDLANSRNVVVAWTNVDTLNADLRCWIIDDTTITEVTNVVANSTDDQGLCGISIDTASGYWYVFYLGASGGSEIWQTSLNVYYKVSQDSGTTWGPEIKLTSFSGQRLLLLSCPRFTGTPVLGYFLTLNGIQALFVVTEARQPSANYQIGLV